MTPSDSPYSPLSKPFRNNRHRREAATERDIQKDPESRTRGTLVPTKQTGGDVILYGPILIESLAPGNEVVGGQN